MASESNLVINSSHYPEEEQAQALAAFQYFQKKEYEGSLNLLKKLQKSHPGDAKLLHNKCVVEFMKSNQTKLSEFKKNISKVQILLQKSQTEEEDNVEDQSNDDSATLIYNNSVLLYHLHQYDEVKMNLEQLLESVDDKIFLLLIYLLLIDTLVIIHQPEQAIQVINKLEAISQSKIDDSSERQAIFLQIVEQNRLSILFLKTRCYLQMKAMKACKRELKAVTSFTAEQKKPQNYVSETVTANFLKSKFEYQRSNFMKAYKVLGGSPAPNTLTKDVFVNGECINAMYHNNLAITLSSMSKHNVASFYMLRALEDNDVAYQSSVKQQQKPASSSQKSLSSLNMNLRHVLLYNMGIQLLHAGKPLAAFDCLLVAVQVYYSNPRLWLRLTECCIQARTDQDNRHNYVKYTVVGSGPHRKLIISNQDKEQDNNGNSVMPIATMEFASVCLQNAYSIINSPENIKKDAKVACNPGPAVSGPDLTNLRASVLLNSAYVSLHLGNNLIAREQVQNFLNEPNISTHQKHLGKLYLSEALCCLDKISEAIQYLNNVANEDAKNSKSIEADQPKHVSLQSTALINLATAHSYRSELEKSASILQQCEKLGPLPTDGVRLAMFLFSHYKEGAQQALKVLQRHNSMAAGSKNTDGSSLFDKNLVT